MLKLKLSISKVGMKKLLLIIILLSACNTSKKKFVCGMTMQLPKSEWIDSKIIQLETFGFADTTMAQLNIHVVGLNRYSDTLENDTKMLFIIGFKKSFDSTFVKGGHSEANGNFVTYLNPSNYDVIIKSIGYNSLTIKNIKLTSGELKHIAIVLGQGSGTTEYMVLEENNYKLNKCSTN